MQTRMMSGPQDAREQNVLMEIPLHGAKLPLSTDNSKVYEGSAYQNTSLCIHRIIES